MYMNPNNCGEFYKCDAGQSVLQKCPPTLYFDQPRQYCNYADQVKCNGISAEPVSIFFFDKTLRVNNLFSTGLRDRK